MNLTKWWWVGYPAAVVLFIAISFQILFGEDKWVLLASGRRSAADRQAKLTALNQRLRVLESISLEAKQEELKLLTAAVPPTKAVWLVSAGMKAAAGQTGVTVAGYKGRVGVVGDSQASESAQGVEETARLEASLEAADFTALVNFLDSWENKLPLIRVVDLNYSEGLAELSVEGAWKPWARYQPGEGETMLFEQLIGEAVAVVSAYDRQTLVDFDQAATQSGEVTVNPF